ncbi:hypothetical protein IWX92DRAFT_150201 [Phyllosticta citricarpa]
MMSDDDDDDDDEQRRRTTTTMSDGSTTTTTTTTIEQCPQKDLKKKKKKNCPIPRKNDFPDSGDMGIMSCRSNHPASQPNPRPLLLSRSFFFFFIHDDLVMVDSFVVQHIEGNQDFSPFPSDSYHSLMTFFSRRHETAYAAATNPTSASRLRQTAVQAPAIAWLTSAALAAAWQLAVAVAGAGVSPLLLFPLGR